MQGDEWMVVTRHGSVGPISTEALRSQLEASPMATDARAMLVRTGESRPLYDWQAFADLGADAPKPVDPRALTRKRGLSLLGVFGLTIVALLFVPLPFAAPITFLVALIVWWAVD
jgi:hypothetical protein